MRSKILSVLGLVAVLVMVFNINANAQTKEEAAKLYNDGVAAFNAKNYTVAIASFNQAVEIAAKVGDEANDVRDGSTKLIPVSYLQNAFQLYKDKKVEESIKEFNNAIEAGNKYNDQTTVSKASSAVPQLYRVMGNQELTAKNYEKAKMYYKMGVKLTPDASNNYLGLGLVYSKQEKLDSAVYYFEKVVEIGKRTNKLDEVDKANAQIRDLWLEKASNSEKAKKYEEAIESYQNVLKYDEKNDLAYYKIAFCNYSISKWAEAEAAANKTLELIKVPADQAKVYFLLGGIGESKKDLVMACTNYKKAGTNPKFKAQVDARVKVLKCK
jgi:tetratricopeptide (TPR) repeat protein